MTVLPQILGIFGKPDSSESCLLIQGDGLERGLGCTLGPFSWLINILSEECGLFFIQVFF